jgi:hypothetical protein
MDAVKGFFTALIRSCEETQKETGYLPQIIISDHADNLDFGEDLDFNHYVRARWRDRGFIHPVKNPL